MTQSKKIAITGGIGSGKSSAAKIIQDLGYPVFSCDEIYARLCTESEYLSLLERQFPGSVRGGKIDRKYLSALVFHDDAARRRLNSLSHPIIMERLLSEMDRYPLSFAEVPLLFESGQEGKFDRVLIIERNEDERIRAVMQRSGLSMESAKARIGSQRDWSKIPPNADVVENNGSLQDFCMKIQKFIESLV